MLINTKKVTEICIKYKIDIYQWYVLYMRSTNDYENIQKYSENIGLLPITKLRQLVEMGLIRDLGNIKTEKGEEIVNFLDIHVTEKCIDTFFKDCNVITEEIGEEIFKIYPKWINIDGRQVASTQGGDINGIYYDKDKCIELYLKKIKYNEDKHNKIIQAIAKAKEKGLIIYTFRKFVHDELWESLLEMLEVEQTTYSKSKGI